MAILVSANMRILIVEDDRKLARQLKKGVDESGHASTLAFDGREGLEAAQVNEFDVLVLDVMLPKLDGISIVRQLRQKRIGTPILLLTARDTPDDISTGLDAGADDYLTKPFAFKVLLARLRALARRRHVDPRTLLRVADLSLDPATHEVMRSGASVGLSRTEFVILEMLMRNSGRVITRGRLIEAVWGYERDVQSNTLDVFIRQLRTKIEPSGAPKLLHTIRGIGYCLREEEGL
jgi:DNA-binding response OmpR family regulator